MKIIAIIGVYIWGALYAAGVFTAALIWDDRLSVLCVIGSAAAAYVCQFLTTIAADQDAPFEAQMLCWKASMAAMGVSILAAAFAGCHLIGRL